MIVFKNIWHCCQSVNEVIGNTSLFLFLSCFLLFLSSSLQAGWKKRHTIKKIIKASFTSHPAFPSLELIPSSLFPFSVSFLLLSLRPSIPPLLFNTLKLYKKTVYSSSNPPPLPLFSLLSILPSLSPKKKIKKKKSNAKTTRGPTTEEERRGGGLGLSIFPVLSIPLSPFFLSKVSTALICQ